jgi:hypothetical protein
VIDRNEVHEGMGVRGSKGEKLGRVVSSTDGSFVFEKGFFFVTDHAVRNDDVAEITGDTIQLSQLREESAQNEGAPTMRREHGVDWPCYGDEGGGGLL